MNVSALASCPTTVSFDTVPATSLKNLWVVLALLTNSRSAPLCRRSTLQLVDLAGSSTTGSTRIMSVWAALVSPAGLPACRGRHSNSRNPNPSGITSTAAGVFHDWKPAPGAMRWMPMAQAVPFCGASPVS